MVFYIYLKTFFVESKNGHAIRQAGCTSGILLLILNIVYIFKYENLFLNHNFCHQLDVPQVDLVLIACIFKYVYRRLFF